MLRSVFEGYAPCVLIAMLGYSAVGGGLLGWIAFVWLFGAVSTVAIAYLRVRVNTVEMHPRGSRQMENC